MPGLAGFFFFLDGHHFLTFSNTILSLDKFWRGRRGFAVDRRFGRRKSAYEPLFTDRGHSIKNLKRDAKRLQQGRQTPLAEAQDSVAQAAGYSSWQEC